MELRVHVRVSNNTSDMYFSISLYTSKHSASCQGGRPCTCSGPRIVTPCLSLIANRVVAALNPGDTSSKRTLWEGLSFPHQNCHCLNIWRSLTWFNQALVPEDLSITAANSFKCQGRKSTILSSCWTKRDSSICQPCCKVWLHVATAIWEGCFTASAMPNRAVLKWCQTGWRAFAQTVTLLPRTTTDGASHAHCVEGYVTALLMPRRVLNLIWTTQADTHIHIYAKTCM